MLVVATDTQHHDSHKRLSFRSHVGSRPFPVQMCAVSFLPSRAILVLSCAKCLQPNFVVSCLFSWHVGATEQNVPVSPAQASSSNMASPDGSSPDLEGIGPRATTMEEKINENYLQLSIFTQSVQAFAQTLDAQTTKMTNNEQVIGSMLARSTSFETNAASGSESPDSKRSWNVLGRSDGSTVTGSLGSHGPGSSDDKRNTRRRLDTSTSPEDEQHTKCRSVTIPMRTISHWSYGVVQ